MRKNDIIEMLQKIDGNPELIFWNDLVQDWQPIHPLIEKRTLTKARLNETYRGVINLQRLQKNQAQQTDADWQHTQNKLNAQLDWELSDDVTKENCYDYNNKSVILLQVGNRNKKYIDRNLTVRY